MTPANALIRFHMKQRITVTIAGMEAMIVTVDDIVMLQARKVSNGP